MKKKILLSSVLTIALCLSLIAGSTFALFTHTTGFNIAVTSGNVELLATAELTGVYYAEGIDEDPDTSAYLIDENGNHYKHIAATDGKTFINGGTAVLDGATLTIERLTPGDRVDVKVAVENKSTVSIQYRYKIVANTPDLAAGMVVTLGDKSYEGLKSLTSAWATLDAPNGTPEQLTDALMTLSFELPVYAGNEYENQSVEYTITVEAVQGNAVTEDESEIIIINTEKIVGDDKAGVAYDDLGLTDALVAKDVYLAGKAAVTLDYVFQSAIFENVTSDVDGDMVTVNTPNTLFFHDCDVTLDAGEMLVAIADGMAPADVHLQLHNVTVNGEPLTDANIGNYVDLSKVGFYQFY